MNEAFKKWKARTSQWEIEEVGIILAQPNGDFGPQMRAELEAWSAAESRMRELLPCGHPPACLVKVEYDAFTHEQISRGMFNKYQVESMMDEKQCSWCADKAKLEAAHNESVRKLGKTIDEILELKAKAEVETTTVRNELLTVAERVVRAEAERDALRDGLEHMVRQFSYQGQHEDGPTYNTGGLSALEGAFELLKWSNPHPCPECKCEFVGCVKYADCGTPTPEGYKRVCGEHFIFYRPREAALGGKYDPTKR